MKKNNPAGLPVLNTCGAATQLVFDFYSPVLHKTHGKLRNQDKKGDALKPLDGCDCLK